MCNIKCEEDGSVKSVCIKVWYGKVYQKLKYDVNLMRWAETTALAVCKLHYHKLSHLSEA